MPSKHKSKKNGAKSVRPLTAKDLKTLKDHQSSMMSPAQAVPQTKMLRDRPPEDIAEIVKDRLRSFIDACEEAELAGIEIEIDHDGDNEDPHNVGKVYDFRTLNVAMQVVKKL